MPIVLGKVSPKFKVISYMRPCLHHRKVSVESGLDMTPVKSHMAVSRLRHQSCSGWSWVGWGVHCDTSEIPVAGWMVWNQLFKCVFHFDSSSCYTHWWPWGLWASLVHTTTPGCCLSSQRPAPTALPCRAANCSPLTWILLPAFWFLPWSYMSFPTLYLDGNQQNLTSVNITFIPRQLFSSFSWNSKQSPGSWTLGPWSFVNTFITPQELLVTLVNILGLKPKLLVSGCW